MQRILFGSALLSLCLLLGCGGGVKKEVIPPLEPVSGIIKLDGKPGEGVTVTFVPAANNSGNPGSGTTNAEGKYEIVYRNGDKGVAAGDFVVMFSKLAQKDGSPIPPDKTAADVMAIDLIPDKFRQMENPRYTVSVPKGGKTFDFEIKTK